MIASTTERQLRRCLKGVRFPASRDDLLTAALRDECDEDTVDCLRAIASVTYNNVTQVLASASVVDTPLAVGPRPAAHGAGR
jgi:uncharacterized protein DUF2795